MNEKFSSKMKKIKRNLLSSNAIFKLVLKLKGFHKPSKKLEYKKYNSVLKTKDEWQEALNLINNSGLPFHNDFPKNWDTLSALSLILEKFDENSRILDAGSEIYSSILICLYLYGYKNLYGINLVFKERIKKGRILYEHGDITKTRFENEYFSAVTCLSVIEHGVNYEDFFKEMNRIIKKGGILFISTDYWHDKINTDKIEVYNSKTVIFSRNEIEDLLQIARRSGFELLGDQDLNCNEKTIHWEKYNLRYTFINIGLIKRD